MSGARFGVVVLAAVALGGCGGTSASSTASTPTAPSTPSTPTTPTAPTTPSAPSQSVTLTNASDGKTVAVQKGEQVRVVLTGAPHLTWSVPTLAHPGVLEPGMVSYGAVTSATYTAAAAGSVTIESEQSCKRAGPGQPCPMIVVLWRAQVTVTG
jgi:hypothetical protein